MACRPPHEKLNVIDLLWLQEGPRDETTLPAEFGQDLSAK